MTKPRIHGFTLIEMLTVIVIVGVMLALTIPAVTSLMKSSGVSVASRQVSNILGLARQLAITQRVYARVCFPYDLTGSQPDMWYRTYAVMTNRDNSAAAAANWRYASKWEYLPVGVVFLDSVPAGMAGLPPGSGTLDDATVLNQSIPAGMPFPDGTGPLAQLAYIEFAPSGSATGVPAGGLNSSVLTITEGFVSGTKPNPTSKTTGGATLANVGTITVNSLVGRIQVTRP